jgi:SAM-dependent methyltransferase
LSKWKTHGTVLTMTNPESERIVGLYQRQARAWAADRADYLVERAWLDRFLGLNEPGATILDLGCGSGKPIARYLIERGRSVMGLDSSPEMIAMYRESFPNHDWQVGDMRSISFGRTFAGIIAWDSFFHLCHDDQRRMFPIFREHAAPQSALIFTSGPHHGEVVGNLNGESLYHASLAPSEYRALLDTSGYGVVAHIARDMTCGGRTVWLAQRK